MSGTWQPCLLQPLGLAQFTSEYCEQRPLHIARTDKTYFSDVVSVDKLEAVFSSAALYFPDVQLTQAGVDIPSSDYAAVDGLIDPARFFARFAQGATVIVSGSDRLFPAVAALCRQASQRFAGSCRANLYLSLPGHQGFAPHYDTHDVMVVQVAGSKTFRLYENNVALPFPEDSFIPDGFEPGSVTEEVKLTAGDTLYIPRGFTHDAIAPAGEDSPSLHLTLGLYPPLMRDVLHRIVDELAENHSELRRSVPLADWQYDGISENLKDSVSRFSADDWFREALPEVMQAFRDDIALAGSSSAHQVKTAFAASTKHIPISARMVVLQQQRYLGHETREGILYCRTFGQVLEFRSPHRERVEQWLRQGRAPVADFLGSAQSPIADGQAVLESLQDSGLCVLE